MSNRISKFFRFYLIFNHLVSRIIPLLHYLIYHCFPGLQIEFQFFLKKSDKKSKKGGLSPPPLLARHFDAFKLAALIDDPDLRENRWEFPPIFVYVAADSLREIIAVRDRIVVVLSNRRSIREANRSKKSLSGFPLLAVVVDLRDTAENDEPDKHRHHLSAAQRGGFL